MKILLSEAKPGHWEIEVAPTRDDEETPSIAQIVQVLNTVQGELISQLVRKKKEKAGSLIQMPTLGQIDSAQRGKTE